jgi:Ca2+-binding RTX toxin-like protein
MGDSSGDWITDFAVGQDEIVLTGADFGLAAGALPQNAFAVDAPSSTPNTFIYYEDDGSLWWNGAQLATLSSNLDLTASDFLVI